MIEDVRMERSTFAPPPHKFEAGTMPIAEAPALAAAIGYLGEVGLPALREYEHGLVAHALEALREIDGLRILGPAEPVDRGAAISFTVDGVHPHDMSQVPTSTGSRCGRGTTAHGRCTGRWACRPAPGRRSTCTTYQEADALAAGIREAQRFFGAGGR